MRWGTGSEGRRLLVLGWHNVEGTWGFPSGPGRGRRGLAQQLRTLAKLTSVVPLRWGLERLREDSGLPQRAVALTFDDGYADNLTLAAPLLERLGLPATFFLVPDFLSGASPWWEELGCALATATRTQVDWEGMSLALGDPRARSAAYSALTKRLQLRSSAARRAGLQELLERLGPTGSAAGLMMDWDGARQLARGFDVQSHTMAHAVLGEESEEEQQRDLRLARERLEGELGVEISAIAYPHGTTAHYNESTLRAARAAGYRWGITTREDFARPGTPALEVSRCVIYPERGVVDLLAQLRYLSRRG